MNDGRCFFFFGALSTVSCVWSKSRSWSRTWRARSARPIIGSRRRFAARAVSRWWLVCTACRLLTGRPIELGHLKGVYATNRTWSLDLLYIAEQLCDQSNLVIRARVYNLSPGVYSFLLRISHFHHISSSYLYALHKNIPDRIVYFINWVQRLDRSHGHMYIICVHDM